MILSDAGIRADLEACKVRLPKSGFELSAWELGLWLRDNGPAPLHPALQPLLEKLIEHGVIREVVP